MVKSTIDRLRYLCNSIPALLEKIPEAEFSGKPAPEKWSKKEILGHLIDSATNNHHRFIRAQFEDKPFISYNQNDWNHASPYNKMDTSHLILFWTFYNRHLLNIISSLTEEQLKRQVSVKAGESLTLGYVIDDYLVHLEHHLKQLVNY